MHAFSKLACHFRIITLVCTNLNKYEAIAMHCVYRMCINGCGELPEEIAIGKILLVLQKQVLKTVKPEPPQKRSITTTLWGPI
jgi:hypothetical protein